MKRRQKTIDLTVARAQLESLRKRAEDMGAEEVLYGLKEKFEDVFTPLVQDLGHQVHGRPAIAPEVLAERAAASRLRASDASARAAGFFDRMRDGAAAEHGAPPLMGWRAALGLAFAAAVIGLCLPAPGWRGCAILALSSALAILTLPLVPGGVRTGLFAVRGAAGCLRDLWVATAASRESRRFERRAWAAADHRAHVDEWVAVQMHQLAAAYEYHRSLAVAATAR